MDGSDDYFSDDLVFDDQALAILDQEEQKYLTQVTHHTLLPPATPRGIPRRRTPSKGSVKRDFGVRPETLDEAEDLPEITLQDDGSYRVHSASSERLLTSTTLYKANSVPLEKGITHINLGTDVNHPGNFEGRVVSPQNSSLPSQHDEHTRPVSSVQRAPHRSQSSLGKRSRSAIDARPAIPVPVTSVRGALPTHNLTHDTSPQASQGKRTRPSVDVWPESSTSIKNQRPLPPASSTGEDAPHPLIRKVEELQKQLQEINQENAKIQSALQAAEDAKLAKVGEVAVLRRAIEKTAQDHAAYVINLKAAKDQADTKRAEMQKSMREEVERMKTQFIFKQHELETANRKPPSSVRPHRTFKGTPSTPIPLPSQIRGWDISVANANQILPTEGTPKRPALAGNTKYFPKMPYKSPEKTKKPNALPGFHNAFATSTPIRPSQRSNISKQRTIGEAQTRDASFLSAFNIPMSPPSSPIHYSHFSNTDQPLNVSDEAALALSLNVDKDVDMTVDGDEVMLSEETADEVDPVEPFNWKIELNRIILTETLPPFTTPSFQNIIEVVASLELPPNMAHVHSAGCSQILETLSATFRHNEFKIALSDISHSLSTMIPVISNIRLHLPLAALFGLLTALCYALPNFSSTLLMCSQDEDGSSNIIIHICETIRDHLEGSEKYAHKELLSKEVISLLEALCFHTKDELINRLVITPGTQASLLALLHNYQPTWLLIRGVRLLILLATYAPLCRTLISMVDTNPPHIEQVVTPGRSPLVERLCYHLTETYRKDTECQELKSAILNFFALLSHSDPEVYSALVGSAIFIPTIIIFISQLTTPIWDDSEELIDASSHAITLAIKTLNQALFLLHYLIFNTTPVFNLKQKLSSVNGIRHFNGLTHTFIVTFGRLCYADTPGWVNQEGSRELVLLTDMAREILDLVVDGPECDNIWQAYHIEHDSGSQTDEEELEANLLGKQ